MPLPSAIVSPLSVPGLAQKPFLSWTSYRTQLRVVWGGPPPPVTSGSAEYGGTASAGFTITDSADIPGTSGAQVVALKGERPNETVSILPDGRLPDSTAGVGSDRWITWRIPDGRFAHVWKAGATSDELAAFAATFTEGPVSFAPVMAVGLAPNGMTITATSKVSTPGSLWFASTTLCPADTTLTDPFGAPEEPACLALLLFRSDYVERTGAGDTQQRIPVGDLDVHVIPVIHQAYATVDDTIAILALGPSDPPIEPTDLAAIIASVQFDPTLESRG